MEDSICIRSGTYLTPMHSLVLFTQTHDALASRGVCSPGPIFALEFHTSRPGGEEKRFTGKGRREHEYNHDLAFRWAL
jgi:hypothetical protein